MTSRALEDIALGLVADGKGILAADETVPTLTKRFAILGIHSTEQSRRTYREMLFTAPGTAEFIGGASMYDETIRFSYGRALQDPALEVWQGRDENLAAGRRAFCHRAQLNGAASVGMYTGEMEAGLPGDVDPPHRHSWRDD